MITDSLARQFLIQNKHLIRISVIEDDLGITAKSIYHWIIGKRPLPSNWEKPLREYLYPMFDENNIIHQRKFKFDTVVVMEQSHILPQFQHLHRNDLRKCHFSPVLVNGADIIYFRFINKLGREAIITIHSTYYSVKFST